MIETLRFFSQFYSQIIITATAVSCYNPTQPNPFSEICNVRFLYSPHFTLTQSFSSLLRSHQISSLIFLFLRFLHTSFLHCALYYSSWVSCSRFISCFVKSNSKLNEIIVTDVVIGFVTKSNISLHTNCVCGSAMTNSWSLFRELIFLILRLNNEFWRWNVGKSLKMYQLRDHFSLWRDPFSQVIPKYLQNCSAFLEKLHYKFSWFVTNLTLIFKFEQFYTL